MRRTRHSRGVYKIPFKPHNTKQLRYNDPPKAVKRGSQEGDEEKGFLLPQLQAKKISGKRKSTPLAVKEAGETFFDFSKRLGKLAKVSERMLNRKIESSRLREKHKQFLNRRSKKKQQKLKHKDAKDEEPISDIKFGEHVDAPPQDLTPHTKCMLSKLRQCQTLPVKPNSIGASNPEEANREAYIQNVRDAYDQLRQRRMIGKQKQQLGTVKSAFNQKKRLKHKSLQVFDDN